MKSWYLFLIPFLFIACERTEPIQPSGRVVTIGVLAPKSGVYSRLGTQGESGLKVAQAMHPYVNNGDVIKFKVIDTQSRLDLAQAGLETLAESNASVIISLLSSNEMLKLYDKFQEFQIPVIASVATDDAIASEEGYVSQVCMNNQTQALIAAHFIQDEILLKGVGIVFDGNNTYSVHLAQAFKKQIHRLGGRVEFSINMGTEAGKEKLKEHKHRSIEALFAPINAQKLNTVLQWKDALGLEYIVISTDGLLSDVMDLDASALERMQGVYVTEHFADDELMSSREKRIKKRLQEQGEHESSYAFLAYDSYMLMHYAMQNCLGYNHQCLNASIHDSEVIQGAVSNFSMFEAKAKREVYVGMIDGRKLKKVVVVY
jgi:branched-chain amino acid transport system substrate-binding protein